MIRQEEIEKEAHRVSNNGDEYTSFIQGAEWADKTMIEKVCEWLKDNVNNYLDWYDWEECKLNTDELLYDFRKAMEE